MIATAYDDLTAQALADMAAAGHNVMTRADVAAFLKVPVRTVDSWIHRRDQGLPLDPAARFPNPAGWAVGDDRGAWYVACAIRAWGLHTGRLPMHDVDLARALDVSPAVVATWATGADPGAAPESRFPPPDGYDSVGAWWRWAKARDWAERTGRTVNA